MVFSHNNCISLYFSHHNIMFFCLLLNNTLFGFSFDAVTCVNFNPVNDNFFISGSIDGKVRIWEVVRCRVVDYIDIREIVTAVCFCPNGKVCFVRRLTVRTLWQESVFFVLFMRFYSFLQGTIVGTMAGNCRFYNILGKHTFSSVDVWNCVAISSLRTMSGI